MSDRRSHQCRRDGCDSRAEWQMFIRFVSKTRGGNLERFTGKHWLKVCERHREDAVKAFLREESLDRFAGFLMRENLTMPHPSNIQFEFGRIQ